MLNANISKDDQSNVMSSFWLMMVTLEGHADDTQNLLDKLIVEQCYIQWNRIMDDTKQPAWVRRSMVGNGTS